VAERAVQYAAALEGFKEAARVREQVERHRAALEAAPKSLRWRTRARIGERKRWYELPEEAH
jgi:hypothetical protein